MRCIAVKSAGLEDWWTIERAEHDGREWDEPIKYGTAFRMSARLGEGDNNYCIEGSGAEMLDIVDAIERGGEARFKRVAAWHTEGGVALESPHNSLHPVVISPDEARELAADIRRKVGAEPAKTEGPV